MKFANASRIGAVVLACAAWAPAAMAGSEAEAGNYANYAIYDGDGFSKWLPAEGGSMAMFHSETYLVGCPTGFAARPRVVKTVVSIAPEEGAPDRARVGIETFSNEDPAAATCVAAEAPEAEFKLVSREERKVELADGKEVRVGSFAVARLVQPTRPRSVQGRVE